MAYSISLRHLQRKRIPLVESTDDDGYALVENVAAVTRLGADTMDLVLRNLRVASRRDIVRLARQLARTEDKLERVLQEVEGLRAELNTPAKRNSRSPNRRPSARLTSPGGSDERPARLWNSQMCC